MNKPRLALLASVCLIFVWGCSRSANIVKNHTLSEYPDITIGAAFNERFYNTKWETVTEKGRKIVRFTGKIKQSTHNIALMQLNWYLMQSKFIDKDYFIRKYIDENHGSKIKSRFKTIADKLAQFEAANQKEIDELKNNMLKNHSAEYEQLKKQKQQALTDHESAQSAVIRAFGAAGNAERRESAIVEKAKLDVLWKNDPQKNVDDAQKSADANIAERKIIINGLKNKAEEKAEILNDISRKIDSLENKALEHRNARLKEIAMARQPIENELKQETDKIGNEMVEDYKKNVIWPTGQVVQFDFIVYPDGKEIEIISFRNESCSKLGLTLGSVLSLIFSRQ